MYELVDERGRTLNLVLKLVRSGGAAWLVNMLPSMEREWAIGQRLGMHCRAPAGMSLAHRPCLLQDSLRKESRAVIPRVAYLISTLPAAGLVEEGERSSDPSGCLPYSSREVLPSQRCKSHLHCLARSSSDPGCALQEHIRASWAWERP